MITEQIPGQTAIPAETPPPRRGPCAWCGKPSVDELVIRKPRFTKHYNPIEKKTVNQMVKPAVTAPVCDHHLRTIELVG